MLTVIFKACVPPPWWFEILPKPENVFGGLGGTAGFLLNNTQLAKASVPGLQASVQSRGRDSLQSGFLGAQASHT